MKTFSKVIFLTLAAYASADSSLWKNIYETSVEPNQESSNTDMVDEVGAEEDVSSETVQDMCPMDVKECPDGSWVNRNAKKDCKFDKCKKAPKPTRKPTKKPTPNRSSPSTRSSSTSKASKASRSRDSRDCVDDESPRPVRSGIGRFRFNLQDSNAQCVDSDNRRYEYGQFDSVREFSDCAEACVKDVRSELLDSFRGFDWNCSKRECRCLYDRGTLSNRNSGRFDRTNRDERGRGSIEGTSDERDMYCGKLAGAEFFGQEGDFQAQTRRAVRGYNN